MKEEDWQRFICIKAYERKIKWTRHALEELGSEAFSVGDVEIALQRANMNERQDYILIVTVYQPDSKEWQNDWRTRK